MQLTYPSFLIGLFAVAVPVIIHLLQLRVTKRLVFTNTSIIQQVELKAVRQRNIRKLLVLITRVCAIIALVLLFCQPYIGVAGANGILKEGVHVLVDNTLSMLAPGFVENSIFSEATNGATELVSKESRLDEMTLLNNGYNNIIKGTYLDKIERLRTSAGKNTSLQAEVLLQEKMGQLKGITYIFSDFQKSAFGKNWNKRIATNQETYLVPLVGKPAGNLYVDSIWLTDPIVRLGVAAELRVRFRNGGGLVVDKCPVKIFLGSKQVAAFQVSVGANATVTSAAQVVLTDNKLVRGRVVTEDPEVTFDNNSFFTLQPAAAINVLEVGVKPQMQRVYANEPLFAYSFANAAQLNFTLVQQANIVLLNELAEISPGLTGALRAVVRRGGQVVVIPSPSVAARNSYQALFEGLSVGAPQWTSVAIVPELREVAPPNVEEPFFSSVFGAQTRTVSMPKAAPVLRWSRTGRDILRFQDQETYLAEFVSGVGKVYIFSAPFSKPYSDFTTHALFVPVLYRLAMSSYREEQLPAYRLTQGTVVLKGLLDVSSSGMRSARSDAVIRLVRDSVSVIPGQRVLGQEVRLDVSSGLEEPGFYEVQRGGKVFTTLAFNLDKRESELAAYSPADLRELIGTGHPNIHVVEGKAGSPGVINSLGSDDNLPLWPYCLGIALLSLLAEALLLRFNGQATRAKAIAVTA